MVPANTTAKQSDTTWQQIAAASTLLVEPLNTAMNDQHAAAIDTTLLECL